MLVRLLRGVLIALDLLLGITALLGGLTVLPTLPTEWLAGSPFTDYTLQALALTGVGVGAAVAWVLVMVRVDRGLVLSIAVGTAMAVFEIVETTVLGLDVWLQPWVLVQPRPVPSAKPTSTAFPLRSVSPYPCGCSRHTSS